MTERNLFNEIKAGLEEYKDSQRTDLTQQCEALAEQLVSIAQNDYMIDQHFLPYGQTCLKAAELLRVLPEHVQHRHGCSKMKLSRTGYWFIDVLAPCSCGLKEIMEKIKELK